MWNTRKDRRKNTRKGTMTAGVKSMLPKYAATFHGVHKWHNHMFEKLGWMVLAQAKGYDDKVSVYKHGIQRLLKTIDHISHEYESSNKKHDLNVLRMNVKCLEAFVERNF